MDAKYDTARDTTRDTGMNCHVCGHFGTSKCEFDRSPLGRCDAFLSWSHMWERETAAIKRAQRATYVVAGIVTALAVVVMILPNLIVR